MSDNARTIELRDLMEYDRATPSNVRVDFDPPSQRRVLGSTPTRVRLRLPRRDGTQRHWYRVYRDGIGPLVWIEGVRHYLSESVRATIRMSEDAHDRNAS